MGHTNENLVELRSCLGLVSCYRRIISDFASKAELLNRLTKKIDEFKWIEQEEHVF